MLNTRRGLVIGVAVAIAMSACGGSGSSKAASASSGTTSGTSSSTKSGSSVAVAPDALVVAKVATAADLTTAFAQPIAVEDDGGVSTPGQGFSSRASIQTRAAKLSITLTSAPSATAAASFYAGFPPSTTPPPVALPGVGDKAEAGGTSAIVLDGAQVLQIAGQISAAGEQALDNAKLNNTITQATVDAANAAPLHDAETAARAIAAKLSGDSAKDGLAYQPAGALDPCGFDASSLNHGDIKVTSAPTLSDVSPDSECVYTYTGSKSGEPGTGELAVYTLTSPQAAAGQPATTPRAAFAKTVISYASEGGRGTSGGTGSGAAAGYATASSGPISAAATTSSGEPDFALLAQPAGASSPAFLMEVSDFRSLYVPDLDCYNNMRAMFNQLQNEAVAKGQNWQAAIGPEAADAALSKLRDQIHDWCEKQKDFYERSPSSGSG